MTANGLQRRIAQLEEANPPPEALPRYAQIIVDEGETEEQLMARYVADHPGEPAPTDWIVIQIVSPQHRQANL